MRNYRHSNLYGPFLPRSSQDEPLRINYVHLQYLMRVLFYDLLGDFDSGPRFRMGRKFDMEDGFGNSRPMTAPRSLMDGDWAGVQGDWGCYMTWVRYQELRSYNVRHSHDLMCSGPYPVLKL